MQDTETESELLATHALLEGRLRILLPDLYRDTYQSVEPVPMNSSGLVYRDGQVAWDEIWGSFCDLAMAGGPSHRGRLLQPASRDEVNAAPAPYQGVVAELCRGIHMVTGFYAEASPVAGWVAVYCPAAAMADWLARAIAMENVATHRAGLVLSLPAGPAFRLEKEIKNVITALAKTTHYWLDHTSESRRDAIADLLAEMNAAGPLLQPAREALSADPSERAVADRSRGQLLRDLQRATGLAAAPEQSPGWVGIDCGDVPLAIALMRLLVVSNVLARREGTAVFVPSLARQEGEHPRLVTCVTQAYRCALMQVGRGRVTG